MARGEPTAGSVVGWEVQSGGRGRNSVLVWLKEQMAKARKPKATPREGSRTRAAGRPHGREGCGEGRLAPTGLPWSRGGRKHELEGTDGIPMWGVRAGGQDMASAKGTLSACEISLPTTSMSWKFLVVEHTGPLMPLYRSCEREVGLGPSSLAMRLNPSEPRG